MSAEDAYWIRRSGSRSQRGGPFTPQPLSRVWGEGSRLFRRTSILDGPFLGKEHRASVSLWLPSLRQDFPDHVPVHVRQPPVDAVVTDVSF